MAHPSPVVPRIDPPPEHTCGTWHRAGVTTAGCPGCTGTRAAAPSLAR